MAMTALMRDDVLKTRRPGSHRRTDPGPNRILTKMVKGGGGDFAKKHSEKGMFPIQKMRMQPRGIWGGVPQKGMVLQRLVENKE